MTKSEKAQAIIEHLSNKWHLSNLRPFVAMPPINNYAARAYSAHYNTYVVLKILFANTHEREALELFNGNGCVKLLDYDSTYKGLHKKMRSVCIQLLALKKSVYLKSI